MLPKINVIEKYPAAPMTPLKKSKPVIDKALVPQKSKRHPPNADVTSMVEGIKGLAIIWVWGGKNRNTRTGTARGSSQRRL